MDCVFCAIVAGDIPAASVHEDEHTMAFMDIGALREGHTLVIPKAHGQRLADLAPAQAAAVMQTVQHLRPAIAAATGTNDATIAIHDGPAAGQEVPHLHVHIVPRTPGDGGGPIHALFSDRPDTDTGAIAGSIRAHLENP